VTVDFAKQAAIAALERVAQRARRGLREAERPLRGPDQDAQAQRLRELVATAAAALADVEQLAHEARRP
jgi:hypothetical protein